MFINTMITHCDVMDKEYDTPVMGVAAIAQGATGRWCEVMWFGPEWVAENNPKILSLTEVMAEIKRRGGYADFYLGV